jgi:Polyketide cyclase / dehydrase and lipid transport
MRFAHTVGTVAMPGDVWAVWTDVDRWPEWDTELESASIEGVRLAPGAGGTLRPERGPTSSFVVSEFEPERGYAFTTQLPLCKLVVRRRLGEDGNGGTAFTHEVSFVGSLSFLFGTLLGRRFRAALPGVMENVRLMAESRYRSREASSDSAHSSGGSKKGGAHDDES